MLREDLSAKSGIDGNICGWSGHPDGFEETLLV